MMMIITMKKTMKIIKITIVMMLIVITVVEIVTDYDETTNDIKGNKIEMQTAAL